MDIKKVNNSGIRINRNMENFGKFGTINNSKKIEFGTINLENGF